MNTTANRVDYWSSPWRSSAEPSVKATWFNAMLADLQNAKREAGLLVEANRNLLETRERIVEARDAFHGGDLVRAVDAARPLIERARKAK